MPILPVRRIPSLESMPYSTCPTIFKGQALTVSAAGYLTNSLSNYATSAPVYGVAAEQKATASSLATSNVIKVWPADPNTIWEATASGTAAQAGVGSICNMMNNSRGVIYSATAVTTGGSFVIESVVSASLVRGRLLKTNQFGRRVPNILGTT